MGILVKLLASDIVIGSVLFLLSELVERFVKTNCYNEKPKEWKKIHRRLLIGAKTALILMLILTALIMLTVIWTN